MNHGPVSTDAEAPVPRATYRMQFHRDFTLRHALQRVPYLEALGVSHLYASPLLQACPGSTHGYDQTDPSRINAELGTEEDLEALVQALRSRGMGLVLDIVPNHMATDARNNPWWWDLLKHGARSRFAPFFDIDWGTESGGKGRILLPVLGDSLDAHMERDELRLDRAGSDPVVRYFDHVFPVDPDSLTGSAQDAGDVASLLQRQNYRLVHWREGDRLLNYRRFFSITSLAGVRVELPEAFEATHARVFEWYRKGWLDGLRVDHPDGLREPTAYLNRLRHHAPRAWITVEKILEPGERLPGDWPVAGTTGYDFMHDVGGIFVDPSGEGPLTEFYAEFTGEPIDDAAIVLEKKRLVLETLFQAEISRLLPFVTAGATQDVRVGNIDRESFRRAIIAIAACFPVYRTYVQAGDDALRGEDAQWIEAACARASELHPDLDPAIAALRDILMLRTRGDAANEFVQRFQQLTGPAMAKGVEDTAFYCFNRMIALNEVGGDPGGFGVSLDALHETTRHLQAHWPHRMLATTTHDTKRSEDVRSRLLLLTEIPDRWSAAVRRWSRHNEKHRTRGLPDRNAEYLLYQTLVGAWPLSTERAVDYMEKASREAKQHTQWTDPNTAYEEALKRFVESVLADKEFRSDFEGFVDELILPGRIQSLSQTLIKLTAPGVPDIYQGTELWDLSLVDPDNRRPVDYDHRERLMRELGSTPVGEIWRHHASGLPKLWLIRQVLALRRQLPGTFAGSSGYLPIRAAGKYASHVIAFMRGDRAITVATRFALRRGDDWSDTEVELPHGEWHNALSGEAGPGGMRRLADLLGPFPVALLVLKDDQHRR